MRRRSVFMAILLVVMAAAGLWAWSYRVHHSMTDGAVDLLPEPVRTFYDLNRSTLVYHSTDPDVWVELKINAPASTHYIDLDLLDAPPFDNIPRSLEDARAKYGDELLRKAGTLPWEVGRRARELTQSFREKRWKDVVMQSSWISHFIADSTMPLHATKNYKGQDTGNLILEEHGPNRTVHQRLEWGLPERFASYYDAIKGDPAAVARIDDVTGAIRASALESFGLVDAVLDADKAATAVDNQVGDAYYAKLDELLRSVVTARMKRGEELIASIWLTCWEDAGRPELPMCRVNIELPHIENPAGARSDGSTTLLIPLVVLMAGVAGLILGSQLTLAVLRRQRS